MILFVKRNILSYIPPPLFQRALVYHTYDYIFSTIQVFSELRKAIYLADEVFIVSHPRILCNAEQSFQCKIISKKSVKDF